MRRGNPFRFRGWACPPTPVDNHQSNPNPTPTFISKQDSPHHLLCIAIPSEWEGGGKGGAQKGGERGGGIERKPTAHNLKMHSGSAETQNATSTWILVKPSNQGRRVNVHHHLQKGMPTKRWGHRARILRRRCFVGTGRPH
jgi:hypothetical protein